jgi:hypothetical protein
MFGYEMCMVKIRYIVPGAAPSYDQVFKVQLRHIFIALICLGGSRIFPSPGFVTFLCYDFQMIVLNTLSDLSARKIIETILSLSL